MSWLGKLFGAKDTPQAKAPEGEDYKGCTIFPDPISEGNTYRLSARITAEVNGEPREHRLIRADTFTDQAAAIDASRAKAKQMIDQMGMRVFD